MAQELILASTSRYRAELLGQLGWPFTTQAPEVDEDQLKNKGVPPRELALELSRLKAEAVHRKHPQAWVIGSDQVCAIGTKIFSKPRTKEGAITQLSELSGKVHELLTAVTISSPKGSRSFINTARLHMRTLSLEQIQKYVEEEMPLDCAGSYKLEQRGIKLFSKIEMNDHTAIIGLPLIELSEILMNEGFPL